MSHWTEALVALRACSSAVEWCRGYATLEDAWRACERGDWMLWLMGRLSGDRGDARRRPLAACLADVAALALPYADTSLNVCEETIGVVRAWARGDASDLELHDAKMRILWRADGNSSIETAYCAADYPIVPSIDAPRVATNAANYAAYVAYIEAKFDIADAVRSQVICEIADIVRCHYPTPPVLLS